MKWPLALSFAFLCACQAPAAFRVPRDTAGAQVSLAGLPASSTVELISPSGRRLASGDVFVTASEGALKARPLRALTLTNPFELIEAGDWEVEVSPPSTFTVSTRFSPLVSEGEFGVIDLRFILAMNCLADVATTRARVERYVQRSALVLYLSRLQTGEVHIEEQEVTPCSLTREVTSLKEFATASPEAVFVVTNALETTKNGDLSGWAPIAGTMGVAATELGVGTLAEWALEGDGYPSNILVHELGHWAGLHHSIESDGVEDTLEDTPSCAPWIDGNGNGVTDAADCGLEATYNFMFWGPRAGATSDAQAKQLQRALTSRVVKQ